MSNPARQNRNNSFSIFKTLDHTQKRYYIMDVHETTDTVQQRLGGSQNIQLSNGQIITPPSNDVKCAHSMDDC
jgi:hypothetical protein